MKSCNERMRLFLNFIHSFLQYIKKHPIRVGIFALISVIIAVFYQYAIRYPLLAFSSGTKTSTIDERANKVSSMNSNQQSRKLAVKNAQRSRLLLRVRKQFDIACKSFLPTLRKRIFETIDVNNTIRQIKEIRSSGQQFTDLENDLWEDVKISAFGQLFATIYLLSAVCTLLKIQLHILARHLAKTEVTGLDIGEEAALDGDMFKALVEGTYRQMFGIGLQNFSGVIMEKLRFFLKEWTVKEKVKVEYEEIRELFENTRSQLESNFTMLVKDLFIPPEADSPLSPYKASPVVQKLLNQIWDVVESPVFQVVYSETLDSCYQICFELLRKFIFQPETSPMAGYDTASIAFRAPPLASVLPQLKSIANRLLPDSTETPLNNQLKSLSSGALLDSLCISIFDAEDE